MQNKELALRHLDDTDLNLLTVWLNKPYILSWYHDADEWLAEINERHGAYAWIRHFIVMEGETPIGFCQYYDCCDANDMEDWYSVTTPGDTFSIDYLIGNEAYLSKGYGKAIIRLLSNTIQAVEAARRIIVQPDAENHASNHVLLANGYIYDAQQEYFYKSLN
ncbi:MAG: GNAT family N-acetyltransferase [Bacillota bacterium]|uniref:GNAT family N-acetyltransferase n=1 Tax=Desulfitobacterium hafniense TaxID=49338 RepID=UPI000361CEDA|nr:GNAT family N-acetyltransferase [Desulfitobacterium hafniense]